MDSSTGINRAISRLTEWDFSVDRHSPSREHVSQSVFAIVWNDNDVTMVRASSNVRPAPFILPWTAMRFPKLVIQRLLGSIGHQIVRKGTVIDIQRRIEAATEMECLYRQFVFPDLPTGSGRGELLAQLVGTQLGEAFYLLNALHRSMPLDGDICEFGVAQGATSTLMANEIRSTSKSLWLFDSFEGLPKPSAKDVLIDDIFNLGAMEKYQGQMACQPKEVRARLKSINFPFGRVQLVPGFIEQTIHRQGLPSRVCFSYVDFDFYEPITTALNFLHERLPIGGHIVVDDYGWFSSGAKAATDEFVARHSDKYVMSLPLQFAGHFAVLQRV
jgi:O-methyltransferase